MRRECLLLAVLAAAPLHLGTARAEPLEAPHESRVIVFVAPGNLGPERVASLRKAIEAQFAGVDAQLTFDTFEAAEGDLGSRARSASALSKRHAARGVFWVEALGEDWLLYLTEPDAERILVRRLSTKESSPAAVEETLSLIARQSASALLAGQKVGMQPVTEAPSPPPPARSVPPRADSQVSPSKKPSPERVPEHKNRTAAGSVAGPWLEIGYVGTTYAQQLGWQSGISGGVRLASERGYYFRAAYVFTETVDVRSPVASIEVSRHPIELYLGWRFSEASAALRVELGYVLDVVTRSTVAAQAGLAETPDAPRVVSAIAPRVGFEFRFTNHLALFALAGTDVVLNDFDFLAEVDGVDRLLLNPHSIRASGSIGVGFHP